MWKTTDAISSGLRFTLAGGLAEPRGWCTEGARRAAPAPLLGAGAGGFPQHWGPGASPIRKYDFESCRANQLTGCVTLLNGIW